MPANLDLKGRGLPTCLRANSVSTACQPWFPACRSNLRDDGVRHHTEDTFLVKTDGVEHWTADCPRELVVPV